MVFGKMEKAVSIVIANWNGEKVIAKCLDSLRQASRFYNGQIEIIVVDDESKDDSRDIIKANYPEVKLVVNEKNKGFGETASRGIKESKNDIVILLNNDVEVENDFIDPLVSHFEDPSVFAVSCRSFFHDRKTFNEGRKLPKFVRGFIRFPASSNKEPSKDLIDKTRAFYSFYAVGGHCAYSREKFLALGGFSPLYYPFYWEDVDVCYRAWKRGWETVYEPKSIVYHGPHGVIKEKNKNRYVKTIMNRNRILLVWKNCQPGTIFTYHFFPIVWKLLTYFFILDFNFYRSFGLAVKKICGIQRERKKEKKIAVKTDREIFQLCKETL
ncbi:MAG: glycosyltransferase family 2 protein [bacterium]